MDGTLTPRRKIIIFLSTVAAENLGGLDVCKSKCHNLTDEHVSKRRKEMRCCASCHPGYLPGARQKEVEQKYGWKADNDLGYWGPGGCRLRREDRPEFCLTYTCQSLDKHASQANALLMAAKHVELDGKFVVWSMEEQKEVPMDVNKYITEAMKSED